MTPRVFLSYSHDTEAHRAWVRRLAERLVQGGVEVTLDQWQLRFGEDLVRFMEQGIRDADRVLMVCTANYVAKAEERKGGAGNECMIVTGYVARATDTIKFVPIVRDNTGETLLPDFLGQRRWVDFRDDGAFEKRLEELLRELHGVPLHQPPPLGPNPFARLASPEPSGRGVSVGGNEAGAPLDATRPSASAPQAAKAPASSPAATGRPLLALSPLTVPTARLRREGKRWQVERQEARVQACEVELGEGESLRLIQIPAGEFLMGSPDTEPQRSADEGPQHLVRLDGFLLGQTPVTQAQWAVVARWPKLELDLNPAPSRFKGPRRPVEQVSWKEAMEFCRRLSQRWSGLSFTLSSEAQWEYACRAGSTTPFAFGPTLTPELANYNGNHTYANGPKGDYRQQTTDVGHFLANAWGLQDMHGNVWEWCLDNWHGFYQGAPTDGSPWLEGVGGWWLLRGGSWDDPPGFCRSAYRSSLPPGLRNSLVGFRVCCLPQD